MTEIVVTNNIIEVQANSSTAVNEVTIEISAPVEVSASTVGIQGPSGNLSTASYTHTQSSASTTWTINHNLDYRPNVSVLSVGGVEMEATVLHTNANQTVITFNAATAGTARLI